MVEMFVLEGADWSLLFDQGMAAFLFLVILLTDRPFGLSFIPKTALILCLWLKYHFLLLQFRESCLRVPEREKCCSEEC